jgi:gentisate 1,2-dioxygenase
MGCLGMPLHRGCTATSGVLSRGCITKAKHDALWCILDCLMLHEPSRDTFAQKISWQDIHLRDLQQKQTSFEVAKAERKELCWCSLQALARANT